MVIRGMWSHLCYSRFCDSTVGFGFIFFFLLCSWGLSDLRGWNESQWNILVCECAYCQSSLFMRLSFIWPPEKCGPRCFAMSSFLLHAPVLNLCQMLCEDVVGGFGRSHEKQNFLWALRKVTGEQKPNLTVAVPLFFPLLKIIVLWIWRNICSVVERHRSPICLFLGCIAFVYILECMFVQTPHPLNPCVIRNVLCMVAGRVEYFCDTGLVFSSMETVVLLPSVIC